MQIGKPENRWVGLGTNANYKQSYVYLLISNMEYLLTNDDLRPANDLFGVWGDLGDLTEKKPDV